MGKLLEGLKSYFQNTPKEQILKDWANTEKYDGEAVIAASHLQDLWEHMSLDYKLNLTDDELEDIVSICNKSSYIDTLTKTPKDGVVVLVKNEFKKPFLCYIDVYKEWRYAGNNKKINFKPKKMEVYLINYLHNKK